MTAEEKFKEALKNCNATEVTDSETGKFWNGVENDCPVLFSIEDEDDEPVYVKFTFYPYIDLISNISAMTELAMSASRKDKDYVEDVIAWLITKESRLRPTAWELTEAEIDFESSEIYEDD